jgi:hypothetical protein
MIDAPLEIADGAHAYVRALGQLFLRQTTFESLLTQQASEP